MSALQDNDDPDLQRRARRDVIRCRFLFSLYESAANKMLTNLIFEVKTNESARTGQRVVNLLPCLFLSFYRMIHIYVFIFVAFFP